MAKNTGISKAAPVTLLEAFGRVQDLADAISGLRIAAQSQMHPLTLPDAAVQKLIEAHQAMLQVHRELEKALVA